jgi:Sulfotransferase family
MPDPKFLFILTPSHSGSTVLVKHLNTSPYSMLLNSDGEGQWLVPGLSDSDRWNPEKQIDWKEVRQTWLKKYHEINRLVANIQVVLEKSPPNLVRFDHFKKHFQNSVFMVLNRDPYANCSSKFHRTQNSDKFLPEERLQSLSKLAADWVVKSSYLFRAIEAENLLFFTYEQFCEEPEICLNRVLELCPELEQIDTSVNVRVKDYPAQQLSNQNQRQIDLLHANEIEAISSILAPKIELLQKFGYQLRS